MCAVASLYSAPSCLLFEAGRPNVYLLSGTADAIGGCRMVVGASCRLPLPGCVSMRKGRDQVFFVCSSRMLYRRGGLSTRRSVGRGVSDLLKRVGRKSGPIVFACRIGWIIWELPRAS